LTFLATLNYLNSSDRQCKTALFQDLILRLPHPKTYAEGHLQWAILCWNNGDSGILEDELQQLRSIDSLAKY
jgi:hypothetical protein